MGTLRDVWGRLKGLLDAALKAKLAPGAKADPAKTAAAVKQFMSQFASLMTELEANYKTKAQVDAKFRNIAERGIKLLQPFVQQVDAAHKLGFNPDNSQHDNLDGRLDEMLDRMKDLRKDGSGVQWD
jgi:hypothetical protein